jgi:hypothetical protein
VTKQQLTEVMLFHLRNLGTCQQVGLDTKLKDCLSTTSAVGGNSPAVMFENTVKWTIKSAGLVVHEWPAGWLGLTVDALAAGLLSGEFGAATAATAVAAKAVLDAATLRAVMVGQALMLGTCTVVTDQTVQGDCLPKDGTAGNLSPREMYRSVVIWTIKHHKRPVRTWPADWPQMTIGALADYLAEGWM